MERALIPTGIFLSLPVGYEAQVRPRSGLAVKYGVTVVNSPGTIDSDYTGEIKVPMINLGQEDFTIERGMRIAQMVVQKVVRANLVKVSSLKETDRGQSGFGSTGQF
jgi:dUTP pyrophosphatase